MTAVPPPESGDARPDPTTPAPWAAPPSSQPGSVPPPPMAPGSGLPPATTGQPVPPPVQYGVPAQHGVPDPTGWGQPEVRPGIIPLRPLALNDIYAGVMTAIRGNLGASLGLSLIVTLICVIPGTLLSIAVARSGSFVTSGVPDEVAQDLQDSVSANLTGIFQGFGTFLLSSFMAFIIGRGAIGQRVSVAQTWAGTKRRLPRVLGGVVLTVLAFIAVALVLVAGPIALAAATSQDGWLIGAFVGLFAMFVIWFILWVKLAFVSPAIVLEESSILTGFRRSWRLTQGAFWRIWGIRALAAIVVAVVTSIIAIPTGGIVGAITSAADLSVADTTLAMIGLTSVVTVLTSTLTAPFLAGVDALLYLDMRIRKEGLDVQLMNAAAGTR